MIWTTTTKLSCQTDTNTKCWTVKNQSSKNERFHTLTTSIPFHHRNPTHRLPPSVWRSPRSPCCPRGWPAPAVVWPSRKAWVPSECNERRSISAPQQQTPAGWTHTGTVRSGWSCGSVSRRSRRSPTAGSADGHGCPPRSRSGDRWLDL